MILRDRSPGAPAWASTLLPSGLLVLGLLACTLGPLAVLLWIPDADSPLDPFLIWHDDYLRHLVSFSLEQALLSTLLSLCCAIPLARSLFYHQFPGKNLLLKLFSLSQVLPVIIALFGLVAVHGAQGWIAQWCHGLGVPEPHYLFGLSGILLAHVFFNMPLAARWLHATLEQTPPNYWLQARQLGMNAWQRFFWLEWPFIKKRLPGLASLIFMLCFTSFTLVMALGGGPAATTLEVAIYQAIRFDYDLPTASLLACWQFALGIAVIGLYGILGKSRGSDHLGSVNAETGSRLASPGDSPRWLDIPVLILCSGFFLLPLLAIVWYGVTAAGSLLQISGLLWQTTLNSLATATAAGILAVLLGLLLLLGSRTLALRLRQPWLAQLWVGCGSMILLIPISVISTGLFVAFMPFTDLFAHGQIIVIGLNALAVLPYLLRVLQNPCYRIWQQYDALAATLGMGFWARLSWLEWPLLCQPVCQALALGVVFSLGDLAAIALFGSDDFQTLPWLLYQQIAHYQMDAAATTALILLILCCSMLYLLEHGLPRLLTGRPSYRPHKDTPTHVDR